MSTKIIVRQATVNDLDLIAHLLSIGIGGQAGERRTVRRTDLENNPRYNYRHIIIAEIDGQPAGTATAFPTQIWLSGVPLQMGAITGLAIRPDAQYQSVGSALMQRLLENMARDGIAISGLFSFGDNLYQQYGYANAAAWHAYSIKPHNLSAFDEAKGVRPFEMDDLPTLRSIYRGGQLSQADGRLTRTNSWWERVVAADQPIENTQIVVYEGDMGVEGYLKYHLDEGALKVIEMFVYSDPAYRGLWGYMADQPDIVSIDYLASADDPILQMLNAPDSSRGEGFGDSYQVIESLKLRVIDVSEALTSRFYPHNMMGNRIFKINDPQLPANQELINFRIVDGRPDIIPVEGKSPDIETDIATLSQIFCGFLSPEAAHRLGKLRANEETQAWLSKAMATNPLFIHAADWF